MKSFDLGIAWNWEYDADFVRGIEQECTRHGVSTYRIETHNCEETLHLLRTRKISFHTFLDRASDADDVFIPLAKFIAKSGTHVFNNYEFVEYAKDKATMHLELIAAGLHTPYTIIISPVNKKKEIELSLTELAHLGRPFIIKPANTTGGGVGVVIGAETLKQIIETRKHHKNDKYLLQETVVPQSIEKHKAWFRIIFAFGISFLCWWDHETHRYRKITKEEERHFHLHHLYSILRSIHSVCHLDFFSSEVALVHDGRLIVIDYVNEICDMRLQSAHYDGVPDDIVHEIHCELAKIIKSYVKKIS